MIKSTLAWFGGIVVAWIAYNYLRKYYWETINEQPR